MSKKGDKCKIDNCDNLVNGHGKDRNGKSKYMSVCTKHHKLKYNMPRYNRQREQKDVLYMSKLPCSRCGWNKSYCDKHRIIQGKDGGKYTEENTIPLCPNWHRVEHNKDVFIRFE